MPDSPANGLFVFEMANNHMGDVEHGLRIIREIHEVCKPYPFRFGFKFQYRDIDTFIHPAYRDRKDIKYVKRFIETRLTKEQFGTLKKEVVARGFLAVCTPFDEASVDLFVEHGFDVLKIASCSFTDWPLLEKVSALPHPLIASTAGSPVEDIDRVVSFFEHRNRAITIMHCVGEYPTQARNLQLNQIDFLARRYPEISIGYSTHEAPDNYDAIRLAIAKGATVFEKHVGIATEKFPMNAYSATPAQVGKWLAAALEARDMCGLSGGRVPVTEKERSDLRGLQRGVFARRPIRKDERIDPSNTFYAIPNIEGQLVTNDLSKYTEYVAQADIPANAPVRSADVLAKNLRGKVLDIINKLKVLLQESRIFLPDRLEMELSHHYGIESFEEWGATIINCINREYCKKLIILLPGQKHPPHHHVKKEETFHILYGDVTVKLAGDERKYRAGEMIIVERNVSHDFRSEGGAIIEEISTTHYKDDSFYADERIKSNVARKTQMTFWSDWLNKPIR